MTPSGRNRRGGGIMAYDRKTGLRPSGRIAALGMDGKKTVLAISLVLVMAVMWIRVLVGHKPASAGAAPQAKQEARGKQVEPAAKVRMVDVPKVPGRNDCIERDCFKMQDRAQFQQSAAVQNPGADPEVPVVSPNHDQEVVQQVAQTLKLEAVSRWDGSQAFVNDQWVKVGDRFLVKHGTGFLEFEVLRIYEDAVLVECNNIQQTLKLAQVVDVRK